jgi:hypothetical protein
VPADAVVVGTPTDVSRVLGRVARPLVPVSYGLDPAEPGGGAELAAVLAAFFERVAAGAPPAAGAVLAEAPAAPAAPVAPEAAAALH